MGKLNGFKEIKRQAPKVRIIKERIKDFKEVYVPLKQEEMENQGARCMACGTPFCNWACPLGNLIPDTNNLVYLGEWKKAYERLTLNHPFPEFTGRICPALCEGSCCLGVNRDSVNIHHIEYGIIERAYKEGWVNPNPPKVRTGKKIAVIGSGPSGLAAAVKLNSYGHNVVVYEKADEVGGLLRYGIPDFKLEKWVIDRRVDVMKQEGVSFITNCEVGKDITINDLRKKYDAVVLTGGCSVPRNLNVEGRDYKGTYYAMEYLAQQNKKNAGKSFDEEVIDAKDKTVIVIGGGDTGSDCIGTANRQGAKEVYQYEIMPKPPVTRDDSMPWPEYPRILKTTTSHDEGCKREWCISTKKLEGDANGLTTLHGVKVEWIKDDAGRFSMKEIPGTEFVQKADLILIAMGFTNPNTEELFKDLDVTLDRRGNVATDENYMTSIKGIFAAGDMRTGQSLVVRAMSDGLSLADGVDKYLMGE
jgi:glutamate synthase (NADPH/NADH) small chain